MNNSKTKHNGNTYVLIILAIVAFLAGLTLFQQIRGLGETADLNRLKHATPLHRNERSFPEFFLIDQNGKTFSNDDLKHAWSFIFFGFTHCPDVCPLTLTTIDEVISMVNSNQPVNTQTVLISVDPERDTPIKLKSYVQHFYNKTIGLTGDEEQLNQLTQSLGVVYTSQKSSEEKNYLIDHSAHIFLVDPNGILVALFNTPHEVQTIASDFNILNNYYKISQGS